ncbi:AraC family transcriptional regulator [Streptomyces laurentii]|uniref:AraC family transcriptional regulator n=1 Tax=Streptomyces laurentii TaxID=39478 RepID=UPI00367867AC
MTLDRTPRPTKGLTCHQQGLTYLDDPPHPHTSGGGPDLRLPDFPGTIPAAFTRLNSTAAARLGVGPEEYAHLAGMAPRHLTGDRYRTPASTNVRIWELMTLRAPWHEVSVHMAHQSTLGTLGVWDYLLTQAPTPLEGLRDAARLVATVADAGTEALHVEADERYITLNHVSAADLTDEIASAIRAYSLSLFRPRFSESRRRAVTPVRVTLAARAPRSHQSLVELYGTREIDFAGPVNSITFATADLIAPQPHAPGLSALLVGHAERLLAEAVPLRDWLDTFRVALRAAQSAQSAEGAETPTLRATARQMNLGTRTLQRRLEEHRTTWSEEIQSLRRERTLRLLASTGLPLDAVARRAGYADAGGMRRAVRRWTGRPVASLRAREDVRVPDEPPNARSVV